MAEETTKPTPPELPDTLPAPAPTAPATEAEVVSPPAPDNPADQKPAASADQTAQPSAEISQSASFKEETNVVSELPDHQRKALEEFKKLVEEALNNHEFTPVPEEEKKKKPEEEAPAAESKASDNIPAAAAEETSAPTSEEQTPALDKTDEEKHPAIAEEAEKPVVKTVTEVVKTTTITTTAVTDDGQKLASITESLVEVAVVTNDESSSPNNEDPAKPPPEKLSLWGIPLLDNDDDRSDVILLKFLRARDFNPKSALTMLKRTVAWRRSFGAEDPSFLAEDVLGGSAELYEKAVFVQGRDREGRPVVYVVFGEFDDDVAAFADAEKQGRFMRWMVQLVERTVRRSFEFRPEDVVSSFVVVSDLRNAAGYGKREVCRVFGKFMGLLQDNYPEFVSKQVCVNVSFWYLAYNWVMVNVLTPRSKSKFVFANSHKTPETLFKYISPEQVPVAYGGHSRTLTSSSSSELEFTPEDPVSEVTVKPSSVHPIEFSFNEACTFVWELSVVGWDVTYEAQFVPDEGYTVLVSKPKKIAPGGGDDPPTIVTDSFKVAAPGKLVISVDNRTSKKKKLLYRSKIKVSAAAGAGTV